jgi:hypothetical protein
MSQAGEESKTRSHAERVRKVQRAAPRRRSAGPKRLSSFSRRLLAGMLVPALGAGLMAAGFAAFSATSSGASNPPPLGIYEGYENSSGVHSLGSAIGQQPAYAMDYLDATSWSSMESGAANEAASWSTSGYSMTFSVPMLPNSGATLADGAAGDYDSYFASIAQGLVANGEASSILRIGWEFNGDWTAWYADSSDSSEFVTYWQQIVNTIRSVPGADFKFEWCPNIGESSATGNLANYYPGNGYVDYIGEDVYDQAYGSYPGAAQEFSNLETESGGLNWLTSFAAGQGKPVVLGEWGLGNGPGNAGQAYTDDNEEVSGGDDPTFINDMAKWMADNSVYEATYFDFESTALSSNSNPNSYHALIADFGPGGVAGGPPSSPPPTTTTTTTAPPTTTTTTTAPPPTTTTTTAPPPPSSPPPGTVTITTLATSEASATSGQESSMVFKVTVTPAVNDTVTVYADGGLVTLCQVTVTTAEGSGSCALSDSQLAAGLYVADAVTPSGPDFIGSFSNFAAFTISS